MKLSHLNSSMLLICLAFFGIACNTAEQKSVNSSGISHPAATPAALSQPAAATDSQTDQTNNDIAGQYSAVGTNPDGAGEYKADLLITKRDDVYQFSWASGPSTYDGVGVTIGSSAAVSFTNGTDGKGCGVVLYNINADGSLDGKSGYWGVNTIETEKATRKSGTDLDGEYDITGKDPEGKEYKGTLSVTKQGLGFNFKWGGESNLEGFGIRGGDYVAVGFGGKQCSFVAYDIESDGTLDGRWGSSGSKSFGTEVAKPKK